MTRNFYKYVGNGDFFPGVPMRDMTVEEFDALPTELAAQALDGGLYDISEGDAQVETELSEEGE